MSSNTCVAIAGVVIMEVAALWLGYDGTLLQLALVLVAGLGGYSLGRGSRPPVVKKAQGV